MKRPLIHSQEEENQMEMNTFDSIPWFLFTAWKLQQTGSDEQIQA